MPKKKSPSAKKPAAKKKKPVAKKKPAKKKSVAKKPAKKKRSTAKLAAKQSITVKAENEPEVTIVESSNGKTNVHHKIVFVGSCEGCDHMPFKSHGLIALLAVMCAVLAGIVLSQIQTGGMAQLYDDVQPAPGAAAQNIEL